MQREPSLGCVGPLLDCTVFLSRSGAGELHACMGIDVQAASLAPGDEVVGPQRYSDHEFSLPAKLAFSLLGCDAPSGVGVGQFVRVRHDGLDAREVIQLVPGDADDLRALLHEVCL